MPRVAAPRESGAVLVPWARAALSPEPAAVRRARAGAAARPVVAPATAEEAELGHQERVGHPPERAARSAAAGPALQARVAGAALPA
jgi:hypothetical protein